MRSAAGCFNQTAKPLDGEGTLPRMAQTALVPRGGVIAVCVVMGVWVVAGCQQSATSAARTTQPAQGPNVDAYTGPTMLKAGAVRRRYPLDARGFSPVDKKLAEGKPVADDADGSLNPYVMRVVEAYPLDGTYPYHADFENPEYDIYNGVTQDLWYRGSVVAKAYPDGSRCSYCCGLTFEILLRAMKLRNTAKGLDPDDFNGMSFSDLFNLLQLWYIEGEGDSPQRGIEAYGLGRAVKNFEEAREGDFADYSTKPPGGHSVIFIGWQRDEAGKIVGFKYFSSNWGTGVGYQTTKFTDSGGRVLRDTLRIARVGSIENYRRFDRTKVPFRQAYAPNQPER